MLTIGQIPTVSSPAVAAADVYDDRCPLLDSLGDLTQARVALLGDQTIELLCALIRRGCPAALALHGDTVEAGLIDLVIMPRPPVGTALSHMLNVAARVLAPNGRVALCTRHGVAQISAVSDLVAHGFRPQRLLGAGADCVVIATLSSARSCH